MKTYGYLLNDETNPPELWEILSKSEFEVWTLKNLLDPHLRLLVAAEEVWEVATF